MNEVWGPRKKHQSRAPVKYRFQIKMGASEENHEGRWIGQGKVLT